MSNNNTVIKLVNILRLQECQDATYKRDYRYKIAKILLKNAPDALDVGHVPRFSNYTALHIICRDNKLRFLKKLIKVYGTKCNPSVVNYDGYTALQLACKYENWDIVEVMLEAFEEDDLNVTHKDPEGFTANDYINMYLDSTD